MTTPIESPDSPTGTQSLIRGLQLMELLSAYPNGCPLARVAEEAGMSKSTTHRLLQGLQKAGYVTPAPTPGSYRLTAKCVAIGQRAFSSLNIIHVAAAHLESLNLEIGETVNLSALENDKAVMIYKLEPTHGMIRTRSYIGQHSSLYCSAMGKIYLAHNYQGKIENYWARHQDDIQAWTSHTVTDISSMKIEMQTILSQGFAVDREENELGICCVAAPVTDVLKRVDHAISVSLTTAKLKKLGGKPLAQLVMQCAQAISKELGSDIP